MLEFTSAWRQMKEVRKRTFLKTRYRVEFDLPSDCRIVGQNRVLVSGSQFTKLLVVQIEEAQSRLSYSGHENPKSNSVLRHKSTEEIPIKH